MYLACTHVKKNNTLWLALYNLFFLWMHTIRAWIIPKFKIFKRMEKNRSKQTKKQNKSKERMRHQFPVKLEKRKVPKKTNCRLTPKKKKKKVILKPPLACSL